DEAFCGIDQEDALATRRVFFIEYQNARRNAGAVEEVGRQADDAFEDSGTYELLADYRLRIAAKEHAVRQDAGRFAVALHRTDNVQQVSVVALFGRRHTPGEALILVAVATLAKGQPGAPSLVGDGRIGDDVVVGAELLAILELGGGQRVAREDVRSGKVVQDHVHAGEARRSHVLLLPL